MTANELSALFWGGAFGIFFCAAAPMPNRKVGYAVAAFLFVASIGIRITA